MRVDSRPTRLRVMSRILKDCARHLGWAKSCVRPFLWRYGGSSLRTPLSRIRAKTDSGRFVVGREDVAGTSGQHLYELRNQYPETYEKLMKIHREGFHTCSKQYRDADDAPPGFLLFYDNSAFQKLIKTGEPPNSEVFCAIDGDDGDFVPGPQMAKLDFHTQLKDLKMPVLILSGRFDRGMLPRYAVQFKTYAPQAEFVMFEKSGHFPFIEEPEEFIRIVSDFLWK